jgi:hypothetical protein
VPRARAFLPRSHAMTLTCAMRMCTAATYPWQTMELRIAAVDMLLEEVAAEPLTIALQEAMEYYTNQLIMGK